jgi:predicted aspartyl protease
MSSETMSSAAIKRLSLSFLLFYCVASAALQVAPDALSTTLPARTIQGYLMIVSVRINDQGPFDFLVDTGTNSTLIDPALAKQLALQAKDKLQLSSLAKSVAVSRYFLQKLKVGPASVSNLEVLAVPLTQLTALDHKIRGVLGMNFLLQFSFRLDFDHQLMELYPFPEDATVPTGLQVPVTINESRLLVTVASDAAPHGSWKLALDSGICQTLVFEQRIEKRIVAGGRFAQASRMMQVSTNLAEHMASTVQLKDISIAEARLPQMEVVILKNDLQKPSDPQDGLLPAVAFHSVFFDRSNATLIFSPSPVASSMASIQKH